MWKIEFCTFVVNLFLAKMKVYSLLTKMALKSKKVVNEFPYRDLINVFNFWTDRKTFIYIKESDA